MIRFTEYSRDRLKGLSHYEAHMATFTAALEISN